ncbi:MAG: hypothetical protein ACTH1R_12245 [Staphylococcus equorum]|uniref:hypothetical protein n=1 Tax=Staphylococcus TaxID=1279 RepID=UPI0018A092C6|nr:MULTISPECIES: hypothetical protein [Staphylococcus]MBF7018255.1 hypothetical protein [Staphylococcus durrellii]MDK9847451.1 hypothetical protein [Staphylococcus equorum]
MDNFLNRLEGSEQAQFVSIEGNQLTVETEDTQYIFELTEAQLDQCHQQLANKKDATFTINVQKGIIIFNTELSIEEQAEIDSVADYYLAIENQPTTKLKCEIQAIYVRDNLYYADIKTENGEEKIVYLTQNHFNIIQDALVEAEQNKSVDEVYFSYSPEMQKILLNDLEGYDEGDLEIGNQLAEED